jgi:hypothetical protein
MGDNVRMDFKEKGSEHVDLMHLLQDKDQWSQ